MAPLLVLGLSVLPALTRLLAGDRAGEIAGTVTAAVREVTGTDDPEAARAALEANPAGADDCAPAWPRSRSRLSACAARPTAAHRPRRWRRCVRNWLTLPMRAAPWRSSPARAA